MGEQAAIFIMTGAVVAALLTGIFSFVSLVLSKEQKISEFRQQWIDSLRNEIGSFLANVETLTRLADYKLSSLNKTEFDESELANFRAENRDLYISINESRHKITMRLNPTEHETLIGYIDTLVRTFRGKCGNVSNIYIGIDNVVSAAQSILKKEWLRVRNGEMSFRVTRGLFIFGIVILVVIGINWGGDVWNVLSNKAN